MVIIVVILWLCFGMWCYILVFVTVLYKVSVTHGYVSLILHFLFLNLALLERQLDRFIPNRAAMDFDFANYMLTSRKVQKESSSPCPPWRETYRKQLAEIFNMNRTRILSFKNKSPPSMDTVKVTSPLSPKLKAIKRMRHIPQVSHLYLTFSYHTNNNHKRKI